MREFVTESLVLGKVREQFADLEQSSLRNDNFLGAHSHLRSECLKRSHCLLIQHHIHMLRVYGHRCWQWSPRQVSALSLSVAVFLSLSHILWHPMTHTPVHVCVCVRERQRTVCVWIIRCTSSYWRLKSGLPGFICQQLAYANARGWIWTHKTYTKKYPHTHSLSHTHTCTHAHTHTDVRWEILSAWSYLYKYIIACVPYKVSCIPCSAWLKAEAPWS